MAYGVRRRLDYKRPTARNDLGLLSPARTGNVRGAPRADSHRVRVNRCTQDSSRRTEGRCARILVILPGSGMCWQADGSDLIGTVQNLFTGDLDGSEAESTTRLGLASTEVREYAKAQRIEVADPRVGARRAGGQVQGRYRTTESRTSRSAGLCRLTHIADVRTLRPRMSIRLPVCCQRWRRSSFYLCRSYRGRVERTGRVASAIAGVQCRGADRPFRRAGLIALISSLWRALGAGAVPRPGGGG